MLRHECEKTTAKKKEKTSTRFAHLIDYSILARVAANTQIGSIGMSIIAV